MIRANTTPKFLEIPGLPELERAIKVRDNRGGKATVERKGERNEARGYVRVFSRGKTSRVVARLVNTRHPSTVDWGVNLPSKYISIYLVHHVCARSKLPSYFWPRGCNHQYTDYAATGLIDSRPISRSLGSVPLFELFLFVFPSDRFCPTLWFLSYSFSPSVSPAVFDFLDAIELPKFPRNRRKLTFRTREIVPFPRRWCGNLKYLDMSRKSLKFCNRNNKKQKFLNFYIRIYFI